MTDRESSRVSTPARVVAALRELIAALDRRVPHVERMGEIRIASDAAMLRSEAVTRIEELKHAGSDYHCYDQDLVEAIMTDDGGPSPENARRSVATGVYSAARSVAASDDQHDDITSVIVKITNAALCIGHTPLPLATVTGRAPTTRPGVQLGTPSERPSGVQS